MKNRPILISLFTIAFASAIVGCGENIKPEDGGPVAVPGPGINSPNGSNVDAGGAGAPTKNEGGPTPMSTSP